MTSLTGPEITGPGITGPGITGPGITGPELTGLGSVGQPRPPAPPDQERPRNRSQRQVDESAEIKARIVAAARAVFAEKGFVQATLADVATRVGLTRPGLLHHFGSKDLLLNAVLDDAGKWAEGVMAIEPGLLYLRPFISRDDAGSQRLRLVHVLEGEALTGNETARRFAAERLRHVTGEISDRIGALRRSGDIDTKADVQAQTVLVTAVVVGLQKLALMQPDMPTEAAYDLLLDLLAATAPGDP